MGRGITRDRYVVAVGPSIGKCAKAEGLRPRQRDHPSIGSGRVARGEAAGDVPVWRGPSVDRMGCGGQIGVRSRNAESAANQKPPLGDGCFVEPVLLFDLVGTLVDEASDYESLDAAMEAARARFGIRAEAGELSGDFSLALMEILRSEPEEGAEPGAPAVAAEFVPFEEAAKEIFAAVMQVRGIDVKEADVSWWWATFVAVQRKTVRAHPDAVEALQWARRQGHRVWVLTDADPYFLHDVLPTTGLPKLWDGAITAAEAGEAKPHPALFRAALARAEVSGLHAVMIGDSYERDILGARQAGIPRGILVDRHRARTVDDVPVITRLTALPSALARVAPSMN